MAKFDRKLGAILVKRGLITEAQRDEAVAAAEAASTSLTDVLVGKGVCAEADVLGCVSEELDIPPIDLEKVRFDEAAVAKLDEARATNYKAMPVALIGKTLTLAVADPFDVLIIDDLKISTGCEILPVVSSEAAIRKAIARAYGAADEKMVESLFDDMKADDIKLAEEAVQQEVSEAELRSEGSPIVKLATHIIMQAMKEGASDIHIEPFKKKLRIRYRVDGACRETISPPKALQNALVSRYKIMAGMDIAERRKPQDGKFQMKINKRQVDFRVSVLPMIHGEKVCIRILDTSGLSLSLDGLGFEPQALADFRWAITQPYGMLLITGPTGSGKSTTLYSAIKEVITPAENISTVEEPVEYQMDGVNQVPISEKRGLTFASALRAILRQDPDTIMVGEIRDTETAQIAVKAALTGHLVLSTLHTNDAPSSIIRLVDMGIDRFMVASSATLMSAQRLLRKLCNECKERYDPPKDKLLSAGVKEDEIESATWYRAKGCPKCASGYKGRFAILETMRVVENVRRTIMERCTSLDIRARALENGMITLRRCALLNAMRGKTSLEEVLAMTMDEV
ncbi:MAG: ATPase, T2SS/T4P/T4SS family [Planctomycetota bacterium]|nr:ATPase, T2SS/T4P/T4SS family [Planctomycetota bacterium]